MPAKTARKAKSPKGEALAGIIMGSQSDWTVMRHAAETLAGLGVPYEITDRLRAPDARAALCLCR